MDSLPVTGTGRILWPGMFVGSPVTATRWRKTARRPDRFQCSPKPYDVSRTVFSDLDIESPDPTIAYSWQLCGTNFQSDSTLTAFQSTLQPLILQAECRGIP